VGGTARLAGRSGGCTHSGRAETALRVAREEVDDARERLLCVGAVESELVFVRERGLVVGRKEECLHFHTVRGERGDEPLGVLGEGIGVAGTGISNCGPAIGLACDITSRESVSRMSASIAQVRASCSIGG